MITDPAENDSGLSSEHEPKWCYIMHEMFAEINKQLSPSAEVNDLSFTGESDESLSKGDSDDTSNNHYFKNDKKWLGR